MRSSSENTSRAPVIRKILPLLVAVALALGGSMVEARTPKVRGEWRAMRSEQALLMSNLPGDRLARLSRDLQVFRGAIGDALPLLSDVLTEAPLVCVFEDARSFERYAELVGAPEKIDGVLIVTQERSYALVLAGREGDTASLIYHEYLHQVVQGLAPGMPLWLNEGLAEFFETFWSDGRSVEIGVPPPDHITLLRSDGLGDLEALLDVTPRSPGYREPRAKSRFHALSWLLTHFLVLGRSEGGIGTYLAALERGESGRAALERATGLGFEDLGAALLEHLRGEPLPTLRRALETAPEAFGAKPGPMAESDVLFELGALLADALPNAQDHARRHLVAALEADPQHVGALRALARLELEAEDREAALAHAKRAVELDASDAGSLALLGTLLLEPFEATIRALPPRSAERPAAVERARRLLREASALAPERPDLFAGVVASCALGDPLEEECSRAFDEARQRHPENAEIVYYRVLGLLRADREARARRLVDEAYRIRGSRGWAVAAERAWAAWILERPASTPALRERRLREALEKAVDETIADSLKRAAGRPLS